jgi:hypothetical protein
MCKQMQNNEKIPIKYRSQSLHIALENADLNKDWKAFKEIFKVDPKFLKKHLYMTSDIFDYNYTKLPKEQQDELFG